VTGSHIPGLQFLLGFLVFHFEEPYSFFPFQTQPKLRRKVLPFRFARKKKITQLWVSGRTFGVSELRTLLSVWHFCKWDPHPHTRKPVQMWDSFCLLIVLGKRSNSKMCSLLALY